MTLYGQRMVESIPGDPREIAWSLTINTCVGGPMARKIISLEERFDRFVRPDSDSDCLLWGGARTKSGYGVINAGRRGSGILYAHRIAWEREHGAIPPDLCVLHRCDVRHCVNPDHLFLGTNADNSIDMARKGRGAKSRKGLPFGVEAEGDRFRARIQHANERYGCGVFDTAEEASRAAVEKKRQVLGFKGKE